MQNITEAQLVQLFVRMNAWFERSVNLNFSADYRNRCARQAEKLSAEIARHWH